jgi:hypothetical protein
VVSDGGVTFEHEVFILGYQCSELVGQVLAGIYCGGEVNRIFVTGAQRSMVEGVCGGSGEGLDGTSVVGDDSHNNGGQGG